MYHATMPEYTQYTHHVPRDHAGVQAVEVVHSQQLPKNLYFWKRFRRVLFANPGEVRHVSHAYDAATRPWGGEGRRPVDSTCTTRPRRDEQYTLVRYTMAPPDPAEMSSTHTQRSTHIQARNLGAQLAEDGKKHASCTTRPCRSTCSRSGALPTASEEYVLFKRLFRMWQTCFWRTTPMTTYTPFRWQTKHWKTPNIYPRTSSYAIWPAPLERWNTFTRTFLDLG